MYRAFGLDPEHGHQTLEIVNRLGIELVQTDRPMPGGARLGAGKTIWVQRVIQPRKAIFDVSHELAAYMLREWQYLEADLEDRENRLAACLLLPRPHVIRTLREVPWKGVRQFAKTLRVSDACAALRLGEATGDPVALIERQRVRLRGAPWPLEESPERLAKCRRVPPGVFRSHIGHECVVVGVI
jgi:hypothetical protein